MDIVYNKDDSCTVQIKYFKAYKFLYALKTHNVRQIYERFSVGKLWKGVSDTTASL